MKVEIVQKSKDKYVKNAYMAWRYMFSTQKVKKNSPITVDHTLWNDPTCKNQTFYCVKWIMVFP